jgi:hypothetical protein
MVGAFREPQAGECNTPIDTTQSTRKMLELWLFEPVVVDTPKTPSLVFRVRVKNFSKPLPSALQEIGQDETHVSAEPPASKQDTRLSQAHEYQERTPRVEQPPGQGSQAIVCLLSCL